MSEHTPGPWKWIPGAADGYWVLTLDAGLQPYILCGHRMMVVNRPDGALVPFHPDHPDMQLIERAHDIPALESENARLRAACEKALESIQRKTATMSPMDMHVYLMRDENAWMAEIVSILGVGQEAEAEG